MSSLVYLILTSLCVQYVTSSRTPGINKAEILSTMEPYNLTHCKIKFEDSFHDLKKEYIAKLVGVNENTGNRFYKTIENNLVKFRSCIPIKEFALVVEIYHYFHATWLGPSNVFNYDPVNVSNVIKDYGCLNKDGTLGGEKQMKERNKYFNVCLKKMEIVDENNSNITARTAFYKTKNKKQNVTLTIEKIDLKGCRNNDSVS